MTEGQHDIQKAPGYNVVKDQAMKFDTEKIPTELFSVPAYLGVCRVLQFGAKKYAAWNWSKGLLYMRVYAATLRHLMAWATGEDNDQETGLSHIDHAMCELMFLSHFVKHPEYKALDDRPYKSVSTTTSGGYSPVPEM
jgi:hypothetical protein